MAQLLFRSTDTVKWRGGYGRGRNGASTISADTTLTPTQTTISGSVSTKVATATDASSFSAGDYVVLYQIINGSAANAGSRQLNQIQSIAGNTVNYVYALIDTFGNTNALMVKIPEYTTLTVDVSKTLTGPVWNGSSGGILPIMCKSLILNGTISIKGCGLRGGSANTSDKGAGWQGEGLTGVGSQTSANNGIAGGGGQGNTGAGTQVSGGGGGNGGTGSATAGNPSSAGTGGGSSDLVTAIPGGGGGGGGSNANGGSGERGGNGGIGGGMLWIIAKKITGTGLLTTHGNDGDTTAGGSSGGGGGGAGGSVDVNSQSISAITINADQGVGGGGGATGAAGGGGRINVNYKNSNAATLSVAGGGSTNLRADTSLNDAINGAFGLFI